MAKKKSIKSKRCVVIDKQPKQVDFEDLHVGDCFLHNGELLMKDEDYFGEQTAVNLENGEVYTGFCGTAVTPQEVKITYQAK